jgi:hypothetical protein
VASGYLRGDPRGCGAGPDAEGGDNRRPCHGHEARIWRLRRGVGFAARAAGARGKRERARGWLRRVVAEQSGRASWLVTRASGGRSSGEREKGKAQRLELPGAEQGDAAEGSEWRPGSRATAGGRGKLTGGTRPLAAPGEGKVKGRDASRWWAGPWPAAVSRGLCFAGERKRELGRLRAGGLSTWVPAHGV